MYKTEVNIVVQNCAEAVKFYKETFNAEVQVLTNLPKGSNEALINIDKMQIHLFDENDGFKMFSPKTSDASYMWWHITVDDAELVWEKAMATGNTEVSKLNKLFDYGVLQGILFDPFGYNWIISQVLAEIS